jgi:predicted Rossmann fold nucleotide-binding protein DprA/Smf involved in DNA uptake
MKVAVIGSRSFADQKLMFSTLDKIGGKTVIVSGGAPGADRLGERYAEANGLVKEIYKADWNNLTHPDAVIRFKHGRQYDANAGFRRNKTIVDSADLVVAFWDGSSKGTKNALDYARSKGKEIQIVKFVAIEKLLQNHSL